jgi:hypothetical protein
MIAETKQSQLDELEQLLMEVMGQCAYLALCIRRLVEVENFAHPEVGDIEAHLLTAGRVACGIDAHLFDNARGCISGRLH